MCVRVCVRVCACVCVYYQGFGREKDSNRGKFIGFNLIIFCYKEFKKISLCKYVSQSEVTFIVYSKPIENGHVKNNFL